jgi:hypothetical protein
MGTVHGDQSTFAVGMAEEQEMIIGWLIMIMTRQRKVR